MVDNSIVQRSGGTFGARQRERAELKLGRPGGFPRAPAAVAVDECRKRASRGELDRVLRPVVWCQRRVVASLELDQPPGRAGQRQSLWRSLSRCTVDDCRAQGGSDRQGHDHHLWCACAGALEIEPGLAIGHPAILPHRTARSDGQDCRASSGTGTLASERYSSAQAAEWGTSVSRRLPGHLEGARVSASSVPRRPLRAPRRSRKQGESRARFR